MKKHHLVLGEEKKLFEIQRHRGLTTRDLMCLLDNVFEVWVAPETPSVLQWSNNSLLFWQIHMPLMQCFFEMEFFISISNQMLVYQML